MNEDDEYYYIPLCDYCGKPFLNPEDEVHSKCFDGCCDWFHHKVCPK